MLFLGLLFGICILLGIALILYSNKKSCGEKFSYRDKIYTEKTVNIRDIFKNDEIYDGIIKQSGQYLLLAKIEGTNFSILSEIEQDARESVLIEVFSRLDYPYRFISNTCVADTSKEAQKIIEMADLTANENLRMYRILYAGVLEQMRLNRSVLTQQTIMVIPGSTPEETKDRFDILSSSLKERAAITVTSLSRTEDIYDALQDILTPDKIIRPSKVAQDGVLEPIHFYDKEVGDIVQKITGKQSNQAGF